MKHVLLVPVDFSENAWIAACYAAELARKYDWNIQLLHVYQTFSRLLATQEFKDAVSVHNIAAAEQDMDAFNNRFKSTYPDIDCTAACMEGNLNDIVLELIEANPIKFLVMGTKGASGLVNVALGSNTYELIRHSPIGVLAVPSSAKSFKLEKVGLLTNFKENDVEILKEFIGRTSPSLKVALLHVNEVNKKPKNEDILFWQERLMKDIGINELTYHDYEMVNRLDVNEPIPYAVERLVEEEAVDLLLVSYTRKSFFRNLFSRSLPKTIANKLTIPTYFRKDD